MILCVCVCLSMVTCTRASGGWWPQHGEDDERCGGAGGEAPYPVRDQRACQADAEASSTVWYSFAAAAAAEPAMCQLSSLCNSAQAGAAGFKRFRNPGPALPLTEVTLYTPPLLAHRTPPSTLHPPPSTHNTRAAPAALARAPMEGATSCCPRPASPNSMASIPSSHVATACSCCR